jgi:hypothetical protein
MVHQHRYPLGNRKAKTKIREAVIFLPFEKTLALESAVYTKTMESAHL